MKTYIKHIDGLRAVAVLLVCLYHFKIQLNYLSAPLFKGGFIGVDVFFVISGFVITRLIADEVSQGTFSFVDFYIRRIRRLLPAILATIAATSISGAIFLTNDDLTSYGASVASSLLFVANIFFYRQTNYSDPGREFKPLLHFWSLSVEEQYYLVWPFLLVLMLRKRKYIGIFITLLVASIACSQALLSTKPALAFYMMPFRFFEFGMGSLLSGKLQILPREWRLVSEKWKGVIKDLALLSGITIILGCALTYTDDNFPGIKALLPCLGAVLAIYGGDGRYTSWILSNPLAVGFGLISYSLYLVHWPVYVFWRYYFELNPERYQIAGLLGASIVLAAILYRYVEKPFRSLAWKREKRYPMRFLKTSAVCSLAFVALGLQIFASGGWTWRIPANSNTVSEEYKDYFYSAWSCHEDQKGVKYGHCATEEAEFAGIGDSNIWRVYHFFNFAGAYTKHIYRQIDSIGCSPFSTCSQERMDQILGIKAKNVVLVFAWPTVNNPKLDKFFSDFQGLMKTFAARNQQVWVYGPIPYHEFGVHTCESRPINGGNCGYRKLPNFEAAREGNEAFKKLVLDNGGHFADVFSLLCDPNGSCRTTFEGLPLYDDPYHLHPLNMGAYVMMRRQSHEFDKIFQ